VKAPDLRSQSTRRNAEISLALPVRRISFPKLTLSQSASVFWNLCCLKLQQCLDFGIDDRNSCMVLTFETICLQLRHRSRRYHELLTPQARKSSHYVSVPYSRRHVHRPAACRSCSNRYLREPAPWPSSSHRLLSH
jgi:hypothetical protein